jgi:hypothetical protein
VNETTAAGGSATSTSDASTTTTLGGEGRLERVSSPEKVREVRQRWEDLQIRFAEDPRAAVEDADELAEDVVGTIIEQLETARDRLRREWREPGADEVGTEDLRRVLQRYRDFVEHLLEEEPGGGTTHRTR